MPRRILIPLLITTTLIAAAVLLPRTPMGRSWLLSRAVSVVGGFGYTLGYDAHAGNPWNGVTLEDVELVGPGLDVELARLDIGYFLPALVGGALPVSVAVETVRGRIEVNGLDLGAGGGRSALRLRLRELALDDIAVDIDDAPFTLPELGLEGLSASAPRGGQGIEVAGTVVTSEGRAPFDGVVTTAPFGLDVEVAAADLSLARHWWRGVDGGSLDAVVVYDVDGLQVEASLREATIELAGVRFSDLSGVAQLTGLELAASLEGRGLGGPVAVDGTVDIAARQWRANYRATPAFTEAAAWLSPGVARSLGDLGVEADLEVVGEAGGWTAVRTSGEVGFDGGFLEQPIDGTAHYIYGSTGGFQVTGSARWAGGELSAQLDPADGGFDLSARATDLSLSLAGFELGAAGNIDYRQRTEGPSARYTAALSGDLLDRAVQLQLDGSLDDDGWQATVAGNDDRGAGLEGTVALMDTGLRGFISASALQLPQLPQPLTLDLTVDGPLDHLAFTVAVTSPEQLRLERDGVNTTIDPRGEITGTFTGSSITDLKGTLGPLTVSGSADLSVGELVIEYALTPTTITLSNATADLAGDGLTLELAVATGTFSYDRTGFDHRAHISTGPLVLGPVTSEALQGELVQRSGQDWTFDSDDERLKATLSAGLERLSLALDGFTVALAGRSIAISGNAAAQPTAPLATLTTQLELASDDLRFALQATDGQLSLDGELATTELGPLIVPAQTWHLTGSLPNAHATITAGTSTLRANWSQGWSINADIEQTVLLAGTEVQVVLEATLSAAQPQGSITGTATLNSTGDTITYSGSLDTIDIQGTIGAAIATQLTGIDAITPAGRLSLAGTIVPLDGPSYALSGNWAGDGFDLQLTATGRGNHIDATAQGNGIEVHYGTDGLGVQLSNVNLAPFLLEPHIPAVANGTISLEPGSRWRSDLTLALPQGTSFAAGGLQLPQLPQPLTLDLTVDGPLDDLAFTVAVTSPEQLRLERDGVNTTIDPRGEITGTLAGGSITDLKGTLGPLTIAGNADLAQPKVEIAYALAPTTATLRGITLEDNDTTTLELEVTEGTFSYDGAGFDHRAHISTGPLVLGPVTSEALQGELVQRSGEDWTFDSDDERLKATLSAGLERLSLALDGFPLTLAARSIALSGAAAADLSSPLATLATQLQLSSGDLHLTVQATDGQLSLDGELATTELGPLIVPAQTWHLTGSLPNAHATITAGTSTLRANWSQGWSINADIEQTVLLASEAVQVVLTATLSAAQPEGSIAGTATLNSTGDTITYTGTLDSIDIEGTIEAAIATQLTGIDAITPAGRLSLAGTIVPLDGPSYALSGSWAGDGFDLQLKATGRGNHIDATASGNGIEVHYGTDGLGVQLSDVNLAPFLLEPHIPAVANGTISLEPGSRWRSDLALALQQGTSFTAGGLQLPQLPQPLTLDLSLNGSLDDLAFTVAVTSPEQLRLERDAITTTIDPRGELAGTLAGNRITDLRGTLGPLTVSGNADLAQPRIEIAYALAPTTATLRGITLEDNDTTLELEVTEGTFSYDGAGFDHRAHISTGPLVLGPVTSEALQGELVQRSGEDWTFDSDDERLKATLSAGLERLSLALDGFTVALAGRSIAISGNAAAQPTAPLATLTTQLELASDDLRFALQATDGQLSLDGELATTELGPLIVPAQTWHLTGSLPNAHATITAGTSTLRANWSQGWSIDADIEQTVLLAGAEVQVVLEATLSAARPQGSITGTATLSSTGDTITYSGSLDTIDIQGTIEAAEATQLAGFNTVTPAGRLSLAGTVMPLDGPGYALSGNWAGDGFDLQLKATGRGNHIDATASGNGIEAHYGANGLGVQLSNVNLAPFLLEPHIPAVANGKLVLTAASQWRGELSVGLPQGTSFAAGGLQLPQLPQPLTLDLTVDGPLDDLAFTVAVTSPEQLRLERDAITTTIDPRGEITGTFTGGSITELKGTLGPLTIAGNADLAQPKVEIVYALAPAEVTFGSAASGLALELAVTEGTFSYDGAGFDHRAHISTGPLILGPVASEALQGELMQRSGQDWTFDSDDERLKATLSAGLERLSLALDGFPLTLAARPIALSGAAAADLSSPLATLVTQLQLSSGNLRLALQAADGHLSLDSELPAAASIGPLSLQRGVDLAGQLDLETLDLQLQAAAGEVRLDLNGAIAAASPLRGTLLTSGRRAEIEVDPATLAWTLAGELGLEALSLVGIEAAGTLAGKLAGTEASVRGRLGGAVSEPLAAQVALIATGEHIRLEGSTRLAGIDVELSGRAWPDTSLSAQLTGYGTVELGAGLLSGGGELPGTELGPLVVPAQIWQLSGSLPNAHATITAGTSTLRANWSQGWSIDADIEQTVLLAGAEVQVVLEATLSAARPEGSITGTATLNSTGDTITYTGTLDSIDIEGTIGAAIATQLTGIDAITPAGRLSLAGTIVPLDGPSYALSGSWAGDGFDLQLKATGRGNHIDATASGNGIEVHYGTDGLGVQLSDVNLAPFLLEPHIAAVANGELALTASSLWRGELSVALPPGTSFTAGGLQLPQLPQPLTLDLTIDGPLDHLAFTVAVTSPEQLRLERDGVNTTIDPRGEIAGTFTGGSITDLKGTLGPLTIAGSADLAQPRIEIAYALAPTTATLRGITLEDNDTTLELAVTEGTFSYDGAGFDHRAHISTGPLILGPVTSEALQGELVQRSGEDWTFRSEEKQISATLLPDLSRLSLTLDGFTVALAGRSIAISGNAAAQPTAPLATLTTQLQLSSGDLHLTVQATDGQLSLDGELATTELGPLIVPAQTWHLTGSLPNAHATITAGTSTLRANWSQGWSINADIEQTVLLASEAVQVILTATLSAAQPQGSITGTATLNSTGDTITYSGSLDTIDIEGTIEAAIATQLTGIDAITPAGHLSLAGTIVPLDGPSYELSGNWAGDGFDLQLKATGRGNHIDATANGNGIEVHYGTDGLAVQLSDVNLAPFLLEPHIPAVANGELVLTAASQWRGELTLALQQPFASDLRFRGADGALLVEASFDAAQVRAELAGQLLPELELQAEATLLGGRAHLFATAVGPLGAPIIGGTMTTEAQSFTDLLELPAQQAELRFDLGERAMVIVGDGIDLHASARELAGTVDLGVRLAGEPHLIDLELAGTPANPVGWLRISGPLTEGSLAYDGAVATVELQAAPELFPLGNTAGVELGRLHIEGTVDGLGRWQSRVAAPLAYRDLTASLRADIEGELLRYRAEVRVDQAGFGADTDAVLAAATVRGMATSAEIDLDLGSVDVGALAGALGLEVAGQAAGALRLGTDPFDYRLDGQIHGEAAGIPFHLVAEAKAGDALALDLAALGFELQATGSALHAALTLSGRGVELTGEVGFGSEVSLDVSGTAAGIPLQARLDYDPASEAGTLRGSAAGVAIDSVLHGPFEALVASGTALTEALPTLGGPASAEFTLRREGRSVAARLAANLAGGPLPVSAQLAGELYPATDLQGHLELEPPYDTITLAFRARDGDAEGYALSAARNGLQAELLLGSAFEPVEVALRGSGQLPVAGRSIDLSRSDLVWRHGSGFEGGVELVASAFGIDAAATVEGRGGLEAAVTVLAGGPLVEGKLRLSPEPWIDRALSGTLNYRVEPDRFTDLSLPDGVALVGDVTVTGSWNDPQLQADAVLRGPIAAIGRWSYRGGAGTLTLSGAGLEFSADADAGGWQALLDVADYPLGGALPWLGEPRLSTRGELSGVWNGPLRAELTSFTVVSGSSTAQGQVTVQAGAGSPSYSATARLDVDLSDLRFATPLRGRLRGPVTVSGAGDDLGHGTLSGLLALTRLGPRGSLEAASLGGILQLSGRVAEPLLTLNLEGEGAAEGGLVGVVQPLQNRATFDSDLRYGRVSTDLALTLGDTGISATGALSYGDLRATITPDGDRLLLVGEGRLTGVHGTISPDARQAHLEGSLDSLSSSFAGKVDLDLALPFGAGGGPWLTGRIAHTTVAGVALGDIEVVSQRLGGEITLSGAALQASVDPGAGLVWNANLDAVELTEGLVLSASGAGSGERGRVNAVLSGQVAGRPLRLPLDVTLDEGARVSGSGEALGGTLTLTAAVDDTGGWTGTVTAVEMTLGPEQVSLSGTLAGPLEAPRLDVDASLFGAVAGTARVAASFEGVHVAARAQPPGIDSAIEIEGEVWPSLALSLGLEGRSGALQLVADTPRGDAPLQVAGELEAAIGPLALTLRGDGGALVVELRPEPTLDLPGLVLTSDPLAGSVADITREIGVGGLTFRGSDATTGSITVRPAGASGTVEGLRYTGDRFSLLLDGEVGLRTSSRLDGRLDLGVATLPLFDLPEAASLPFVVDGDGDSWTLLAEGDHGRVEAGLRPGSRSAWLQGLLRVGGGSITADLALAPENSAGRVELAGVRLVGVPGLSDFELTGRIDALGDRLEGSLDLEDLGGRGGAIIEGSYPLAGLWAGAPSLDALAASARIRTVDVALLPPISSRSLHVSGEVSGVAQLRRGQLVGRLVAPDLMVVDTPLPTDVEFNGTLARGRLDVRASVAGSPLTGQVSTTSISALLRLERFPLQVLAEAVTGGTNIGAEVTGVARLELPFAAPAEADIRVATELIRLERDGVVTSGNATFDYHDGALTVQDVAFEGVGRWQTSGVVHSDRLDFTATANGADFGPLLGLVPALARLGVGAKGSLRLVAGGSLQRPSISLDSDDLTFSVAGSTYLLEAALLTLDGSSLQVQADLLGLSPIVGQLRVRGGGRLSLTPLRLNEAAFDIDGSATVPILGDVSELLGTIIASEEGTPLLTATGRVGNPFSLEGTLLPLDLRLVGDALAIRAPNLLLASSVMDADVTLRYSDALEIGGTVVAEEARFQLGIRPQRTGQEGGTSRNALDWVRFVNLEIDAPGRIFFNESFASLEARAALVLSGTAATPRLSGTATALRGSIRFSGRDFAIEQGVATFEPARGAYPLIELTAVTSFDKERANPAASQVRFVEPRGSSRFDVELRFQGAVEPRSAGGFNLDFDPELTSDARIEVAGEAALTAGPRSLTPSELLALVTLGRLDISSILEGEGALVTAVAQGALDTAVDLLILAELQAALSEALGVEVVEIRTTSLSSLLDGATADPFGVSLRLGGYLSEEVFASFQIGTFDDADRAFALTNEVRLTYALGPVEFDLAGGVNFAATEDLTPIPELSSSVRYGFSPQFGVEAGVDLLSTRSLVRLGVTLRW